MLKNRKGHLGQLLYDKPFLNNCAWPEGHLFEDLDRGSGAAYHHTGDLQKCLPGKTNVGFSNVEKGNGAAVESCARARHRRLVEITFLMVQ